MLGIVETIQLLLYGWMASHLYSRLDERAANMWPARRALGPKQHLSSVVIEAAINDKVAGVHKGVNLQLSHRLYLVLLTPNEEPLAFRDVLRRLCTKQLLAPFDLFSRIAQHKNTELDIPALEIDDGIYQLALLLRIFRHDERAIDGNELHGWKGSFAVLFRGKPLV